LVGTPVTSNDIYVSICYFTFLRRSSLPQGTVIVILGVIGIVAFGSINSGLSTETSVERLTYLWTRGGWLGYFFLMSFSLIFLYMFTSTLDAVLAARSDLSAEPFAGMVARQRQRPTPASLWGKVIGWWRWGNAWVAETLEHWTAAQPDKQVAWTLGIGWACCGGGLAGGTLVFAKASYVPSYFDSSSTFIHVMQCSAHLRQP
jgi:magnesium transporter